MKFDPKYNYWVIGGVDATSDLELRLYARNGVVTLSVSPAIFTESFFVTIEFPDGSRIFNFDVPISPRRETWSRDKFLVDISKLPPLHHDPLMDLILQIGTKS